MCVCVCVCVCVFVCAFAKVLLYNKVVVPVFLMVMCT